MVYMDFTTYNDTNEWNSCGTSLYSGHLTPAFFAFPPLLKTAKHFIIDDICCYIGSQNLYICDLAEWGVVIDDAPSVKKIKEEYW